MIDEQRFLELESIVKNMVKVGIVESFNQNNATARVVFEDANLKSYDLPIMVKQTKDNKDYWVPDIDEPVICIFLPTGIESGFILGAYYNQKDKPPVIDQNKRTVKFKDGTIILNDLIDNYIMEIQKSEQNKLLPFNKYLKGFNKNGCIFCNCFA